jgi:PhzF family phenazine biosynthesis protein
MKGAETFASEVSNPVPFALVDAFGEGPFTGNPAGVCLMNGTASEGWMAAVAAEIGASETAFLRRAGDGWSLRWFTPEVEVDLCGHATLAAAHLLIGSGETVRFETRSGLLLAHRGSDGRLTLDFPRLDVTETRADERVAAALGEEPIWLGRTADDLLCVLESPDAVERASPRMDRVTQLARRGLAITAEGGRDADITSRFFAPAAGVPEDPVTGSVHCALGPLWSERLGRPRLRARQASPRGGVLDVLVTGGGRVELTGQATTVATGVMTGPRNG